jgi:hypothetical protein
LPSGIDHDLLETPSQRAIFLDVLPVLVQRRGANALDFTTSQGGLQHVRRVDRPFRASRTDQRVKLVNEQDRVPRSLDLVHDRLDTFLELPSVLGPCHHHGQVEHHDPFVGQQFGNIRTDHALSKALDNRRLADARPRPAGPDCSSCAGRGSEWPAQSRARAR